MPEVLTLKTVCRDCALQSCQSDTMRIKQAQNQQKH